MPDADTAEDTHRRQYVLVLTKSR